MLRIILAEPCSKVWRKRCQLCDVVETANFKLIGAGRVPTWWQDYISALATSIDAMGNFIGGASNAAIGSKPQMLTTAWCADDDGRK